MKKTIFVAMIMMIILSATLLPPNNARAENERVSAKILNFNQQTSYHLFDDPKEIFYTTEGLYVSTATGYDFFADGKFASSDNMTEDFAYLQGLITLKNGSIYHNNDPIAPELNEITAISAHGSTLYALKGNEQIFRLDYSEGNFSSESYLTSKNIGKIAASENGCIYTTVDNDRYTNIIHLSDNDVIRLPGGEKIIDIEYNERLFVLTSSRIISYTDKYSPIEYAVGDAKSITVGDRVYILTRTGNIDRIALDLSPASLSTIVASGSDEDWFYLDPVNGTTRLKKIYVADRDLGRIAVIDGDKISYIDGFSSPVAVATDNDGYIYVAHHGDRITRILGNTSVNKDMEEDIIDIQVDFSNNVYCLTKSGKVVDYNGVTIRENVRAFDYQGGWHYMTDNKIDEYDITDVKDFAIDVLGNIFALKGDNVLVSVIDGEQKEYIVDNALDLTALTISKVDQGDVSYGDILLFDEAAKCVFVIDGSSVGSVNIKDLFSPPVLNGDPIDRTEGLIGTVQGVNETYMFALPIEGEISFTLQSGDNVIICKDIPSRDPFVYCVCDDVENDALVGGYVYKDALKERPYVEPRHIEAKVNAPKTPIYKYPSVHSPEIAQLDRNKMISILPFAVTYTDADGYEWYGDAYPEPDKNLWYRIAYGEKEGYILVTYTSVTFFSSQDMPKTNATVTENATLYRYDEASDTYVRFEAVGGEISKDHRVYVEPPFDASRKFTKIVFYREGYGTVDADCYVKTEYIRYDGANIVKIVAAVIVIVALITLILVIIRRRRIARKPSSVIINK